MQSLWSGNGSRNGNRNGSSRWWTSLWGRSREPELDLAPYRRLALQLHNDLPRGKRSLRSVLLVTPISSNLGAHGSAALACCLGEELRRPILLVDVSSKHPETSRIMDCAANHGFADMLRDPMLPLEQFVMPTTRENVWFLPAGTQDREHRSPSPEEVSALLLKTAESRYDFVLLSGGGVLNDSAALTLARYVGCVLLLVTENETRVDDLEAAQTALASCKARKLGLVLTTCLKNASGRAASPPDEHNKAAMPGTQ
jgi:Mrp family chromosome partitioning ATPase